MKEMIKMPDGWKIAKLGDVTEIIMGQSPPSNTYNCESRGLPFFQGKAEFGARYPQVKIYCSNPQKMAKKHDVLMSVRAPVGSINLANSDCCIGRGLCAIRCKNELDFMYLYHFLKLNEKTISSMGVGSTFTAINRKTIEEIKIPLPPLPAQRRIVSILERAEQTKQMRREADELTNKLLQAVFLEMFGDPKRNIKKYPAKSMGDFAKISMGGTPDTKHPEYYGGNINWMKSGDIKGDFVWNVSNKITQLGLEKSNTKIYPKNSVVIALNGQGKTRGTTAILKIDSSSNQSVACIEPDFNIVTPEYLHFNLKLRYQQIRNITGDEERSGLNLTILRNFNISIPPLPLQQKFATIVEKVEAMRKNQKESKQEIENLFNALMQKAFRGELVA